MVVVLCISRRRFAFDILHLYESAVLLDQILDDVSLTVSGRYMHAGVAKSILVAQNLLKVVSILVLCELRDDLDVASLTGRENRRLSKLVLNHR